MKDKNKLYILSAVAIVLIGLFIFLGLNEVNFQYNIGKRVPRVIAIVITGGAIAFSSVIFQTVTNNRIVTPSILGLDALYGFIQTFSVFIFGSGSIVMVNGQVNFLVSTLLMIGATLLLYKFLLSKGTVNIFFLLLVGTIFGTLFRSMSTFMQVMIDPNEFDALQAKLFASFTSINTDILLLVVIILLLIFAIIYEDLKQLDVFLLGRDVAINLGLNYDKMSKKLLLVVSVLVAISTALVGPITFLGILVVNLSYEMMKSYKHSFIIPCSILISIIALVGGQFVVERVLNYNSKISIIINFVGGIYFIYLLLKENKN
ncbi:MAG: iron chelate uptake ABC transporter family permease subunit [Clostridium sp.]